MPGGFLINSKDLPKKKLYVVPKKAPKLAKVKKDIKDLKNIVKTMEKKRYDAYSDEDRLGQTSGDSDGYYTANITANPAQDDAVNGRDGAKIQLTGMHLKFQFRQLSAGVSNYKGIIELFEVPAQVWSSATTFTETIFEANPFIRASDGGAISGIIDYNSDFDPDYFGQYKKLATKRFTVNQDSASSQVIVKDVAMGVKFKKPLQIQWNDNGTTVQKGQIIMVVRLDTGNSSSSTATTITGVANTATNTGLMMNYHIKHYYYDN